MKLWRKAGIPGGKFLVVRRDGTIPSWSHFVMGARDPAVPAALLAYADKAQELGYDPEFVASVRELAADFEIERVETGAGDPDAGPHRKDDSDVVAAMSGKPTMIYVRSDSGPRVKSTSHHWVPSTLGHGNKMCTKCSMTDLEAAALRKTEVCEG